MCRQANFNADCLSIVYIEVVERVRRKIDQCVVREEILCRF